MKRATARTATLTVDAERVSIARSLSTLARAAARDGAPLVCVSGRALADLADELGGYEAAARRLCQIATNTGRPLAVNLPTGPDTSTPAFVSPKGWSEERLRAWIAGHHLELEAAFGPATVSGQGGL